MTKNFAFADGVYLSFAEFQENRPSYRWTDLKSSLFTNPQTFLTQIEFLKLKEEGNRPVPLDSVWGLCLGGIPYVRLPQGAVDKELPTFAGLQVRGVAYLWAALIMVALSFLTDPRLPTLFAELAAIGAGVAFVAYRRRRLPATRTSSVVSIGAARAARDKKNKEWLN